MKRYIRHDLIDWFSQEEVSLKSICVIGAGAVGNELIKALVLLGVGQITIFDFDEIEEHNLTKSVLFRATDVGQKKAEIAAKRAAELDPNVKITFHHGDATRLLKVSDLGNFDCVVSCVDNFEARLRLNEMCRIAAVDFINLGIDSRYGSVEVFPFSVMGHIACYECNLPPSVYGRISERYSCGHLRKISITEKKVPTTIVTSGVAGSLGASAALRLGGGAVTNSKRILVDTISGLSTVTSDLLKVDGCPCCSHMCDEYEIVSVSRIGGFGQIYQALSDSSDSDVILRLSEPVVVQASCTKCGCSPYEGIFVGRAKSDIDESARFCSSCALAAVDVKFTDEISIKKFSKLYEAKPISISYVTTNFEGRGYCFTFEGNL